ncbi:phage scaffolding protein [Romboutsia ilealis]|uniref:phage scaffolding protein n=1 Tax=Romboutsia ilealis TaxID=1115758 RepID=UPI00257278D6|nr:phage scaffolding protein [Romboutsia ilealis]
MKLLEILKAQGATDEQIKAIQTSMKENKVYETSLENADERYNKLKTQKSELDNLLKERDTQLADLSKNNKDNETLLNQIKDLQALNKNQVAEYENKINKMQFDYALDGALTGAKCKNNKALKALLDMGSIKYQEGKLEGLETQLEGLKQEVSYLFEVEESPAGSGFNPAEESSNKITKEQFSKMNMLQRQQLYKNDPKLYEELRK